jgi:DNA-directed RNA polymerase subunit RPC12/RpoP
MDMTFKCPACEQELEVDSSAAGSEIECPACGEAIIIPEAPADEEAAEGEEASAQASEASQQTEAPAAENEGAKNNPIATSAAAKEEKHFKVPDHQGQPAAVLIKKASKPLEVAAKETDRKLRIKTIRRSDCLDMGHDKFDEIVTATIQQIGELYVSGIHPLSYSSVDPTTQKLLSDYGVMIVFKG